MFDTATVALLNVLGWIGNFFNLTTAQVLDGVSALTVANSASGLADQIRNFVGPLAMLACGIFALVFLVQRQFMQMLIFIIIAVVVFAIFYVPEMLSNLGQSLGESNENLSWK